MCQENLEFEQAAKKNLLVRLDKRNIPYGSIVSEFFGHERNLTQEHDCKCNYCGRVLSDLVQEAKAEGGLEERQKHMSP